MINNDQKHELETISQKADEFHGHMGPFLVLGIRMSLAAISARLGLKETNGKPHATLKKPTPLPLSCVVGCIMVTTHCTVGNKKLKLNKSQDISAISKYKMEARGRFH